MGATESFVPRLLREEQEAVYSSFAARSAESRGRQVDEKQCTVRTVYERDVGRILFSLDFRRMRNKTQAFFNPQNDHISTRMEHVLHVQYVASTIGRALGLNPDLIQAIALGHDLGHAPFGHTGERTLDTAVRAVDPTLSFQHERHGLRVVDLLSLHNGQPGLNLTFEVRDGIVSHCGELYDEHEIIPDRTKQPADLANPKRAERPATLEGCLVRMADKIAYVGRDVEDAVRAGIMDYQEVPQAIRNALGHTNGQIINTLVTDIITNSRGRDAILLSAERAQSMEELLRENVVRIYRSDKIKRYEERADSTIRSLFAALLPLARDPERRAASENRVIRRFHRFIEQRPATAAATPPQQVVDFIAGMSDTYAGKSFDELYWF